MAPMVAGKERESNVARLLGSGMLVACLSHTHLCPFALLLIAIIGSAGISELAVFHPVYTYILVYVGIWLTGENRSTRSRSA